MNLEIYQKLCMESKILWTQHCLQRMQERNISRADVKNGIVTGEIIEDYPDDYPNPSCLIFIINFKQFFDLTLCNSANGGKACVYRLSRHLLYGKTTRI